MDKIYGIFDGEYSDWNCLGFFTDELEAEKYCTHNDDAYIIPIDNLAEKIDLSQIKPKYLYMFDENFEDYYINSQQRVAAKRDKAGIEQNPYSGRLCINVVTYKKDRQHAVKIGQDMLAKWKAKNKQLL